MMRNMKALPLMVQKLWQMLKFVEMYVKGIGQDHKVIDLGVILKVFISLTQLLLCLFPGVLWL